MNTKERDNNEMEKAFLGSLLIDADRGQIETRLQPDDFEYKTHGCIYETILKQWKDGTTPTIITLCHDLAPDIPASTIAELTNLVPSSANIQFYENFIFEASKTRNFIRALQRAKEEIDGHTETDTVINNLMPALAAVTTARNEAGIKSAAELLNTQYPDIRWIVPGLIGEGLTLINGAPKIGKSWFVLNMAIAAASGGRFLGELPATKTGTLYLALEDTERRIHSRLKRLKAPEADNLKIATQWRDGYMGLENYLKTNSGIGLVIIDTLARFANIDDMNDYTMTTNAMARLKRIADDLNIAVILIHHAKKTGKKTSGADWMESALGSTGLTGATDSTIFISRFRSEDKTENTANLYATGRDAADIKKTLKLDIDFGGWTVTDGAVSKQGRGDNGKSKRTE
jgi:replicative DNA helicase